MSASLGLDPSPMRPGRTMRAAHIMAHDIPNTQIVAPRELVEAAFARGSSPSASARKTIALMLHKAAGGAWEPDKLFSIAMSELRGSHKGNSRLRDVLDEVQRTLIRIETLSPVGKHAVESAPILTRRIDETDPRGGLVWYQFSEAARLAMQGSEHYAVLNRAAVLAFESRYSVTLYERGAWLCGRQHDRVWRGTVPQLREILGVPEGAYRNWTELRRNTLDLAVPEVDQLGHFTTTVSETRRGRQVVGVALAFEPKRPLEVEAAERELAAPRVGRKARRKDQVQPDLLDPPTRLALMALKEGRDPPGAAKLKTRDDN